MKPLILWQQAVFRFLGIKTVTPRAAQIQKIPPGVLNKDNMATLYESYRTVEDALYGKDTGVKIGDWCDRTKKIVAEVRFPPLRWTQVFAPKNVWPWLAAVSFLLLTAGASAQTNSATNQQPTDPIGLYREGSFEKAGQAWGEQVRRNMTDPVSRNNLGLAWFQVGDKERALANGLSAYLISPQTVTVDWNTGIFARAADQLDGSIEKLLETTWAAWLTSKMGVFHWQMGLVAGNSLVAFGVGLLLASGYFAMRKKLLVAMAVAFAATGLGLISSAGMALATYGKLSNPAAVMIVDVVWS